MLRYLYARDTKIHIFHFLSSNALYIPGFQDLRVPQEYLWECLPSTTRACVGMPPEYHVNICGNATSVFVGMPPEYHKSICGNASRIPREHLWECLQSTT
jgi:hypothetical protein